MKKTQELSKIELRRREHNIALISKLMTEREKELVLPVVGMGATTGAGSDCYPHTIIEVSPTLQYIIIQSDNHEPVKGFDYYSNQEYTYSANPKGARQKYTLRKNGRYMLDGVPMRHYFQSVGIGHRTYYQDPHF